VRLESYLKQGIETNTCSMQYRNHGMWILT